MLTSPSRRLPSAIFLAVVYFLLAACGGSSGGGNPPGKPLPPPDTSPTPFTFAAANNVDPGDNVTSEAVTITGINTPVTVTVKNGQYKLGGGSFRSNESDAVDNDKLTLQGTAPTIPGETQTVTVTVGDYTTTFDIVARDDTEAPEAAFVFPPPMTATEGDTVIVRGTAEDELSAVSRVTLTVSNDDSVTDYEVESDDLSNWKQKVSLGPGENTITLQAEDALGNKVSKEEQQSVTVVQQAFSEAFPDDEVTIEEPQSLVFDEARDRILVTDFSENRIVSVDLATGSRSVFLQLDDEEREVGVGRPSGLVLDAPRNRLLVNGDTVEGASILGVDLDTKEVTLINSRETPNEDQPAFATPRGMAVDPTDPDQVFVLASGTDNLARLDLSTGQRTLVSSNDMPNSGPGFDFPTQLLVDNAKNRALVGQSNSDSILSVDLETGLREVYLAEDVPERTPRTLIRSLISDDIEQRILAFEGYTRALWSVEEDSREVTVISGTDVPYSHNPLGRFIDMALAPNGEFVVGVDFDVNAVYAIDLTTGERLVVSKPTAEFPF